MKRAFNAESVQAVVGKKAETCYYCTEFSSFNKPITGVFITNNTKDTKKNGTWVFFHIANYLFMSTCRE